MKEFTFFGNKYPLYWDIYAHDRILQAAADAGYKNLGEWMDAEPTESYGVILYELMCGGIRRHNFEIAMGYKGGEKITMPDTPLEQRKDILSIARVSDISDIKMTVSLCWSEASKAEVPDELKKYMPDDEYMEIAAEIEREKPESEKN